MNNSDNIALRVLWGPEWSMLSEGEKAIAAKGYELGQIKGLNSTITEEVQRVIDTAFEVAEEMTPYNRSDIVSSTRVRSLVEARFALIATIHELTSLRKASIARALGQEPITTNVRYALERDADWRLYDANYRRFRENYTNAVESRICDAIKL